jgi:hypothetical protein
VPEEPADASNSFPAPGLPFPEIAKMRLFRFSVWPFNKTYDIQSERRVSWRKSQQSLEARDAKFHPEASGQRLVAHMARRHPSVRPGMAQRRFPFFFMMKKSGSESV